MASQDLKHKFNWSELPGDLLCIAFSNLPLHTTWLCKIICKSWRSAVDDYLSSTAHLNRPPLLLLPPGENDPDNSVRIFCPEDRTLYGPRNMPENFSQSQIIGCSFGWLIMMDHNLSSYLLNPFTLDRIELPSSNSCPRKVGEPLVLARAILSSNPSPGKKEFAVIVILGFSRDNLPQLGFLNFGDSEWAWPGETGEVGNDFRGRMLFHINRLYIICDDKDFVEIWEVTQSKQLIRKGQLKLETSDSFFWRHGYITQLFEFCSEVFVIRRHWTEHDKIDIYLLDQETLTWNDQTESRLEEIVLFMDDVRVIAVSEATVAESCREGAIAYDARKKYVCRGDLDPLSQNIMLEWPKNKLKKDELLWIVPNLMR